MTLIGPRAATKPPRSGAVGADHQALEEHAINVDYGTGAAAYQNSRADPPDTNGINHHQHDRQHESAESGVQRHNRPASTASARNAMSSNAAMATSTQKYGGSL
jgi:hypothetical protein